MSIIAKIPVSPPQFHVIVRESESGYTVERNNVFMPARVASSHADRVEAISIDDTASTFRRNTMRASRRRWSWSIMAVEVTPRG
jgi:hypothetical protein